MLQSANQWMRLIIHRLINSLLLSTDVINVFLVVTQIQYITDIKSIYFKYSLCLQDYPFYMYCAKFASKIVLYSYYLQVSINTTRTCPVNHVVLMQCAVINNTFASLENIQFSYLCLTGQPKVYVNWTSMSSRFHLTTCSMQQEI